MKNPILNLAVVALFSAGLIAGCSSPAEKVENAQENVTDANNALAKANQEYMTEMENYRKETNAKIIANNASIAEFKVLSEKQKKEARADYDTKVAALEAKNNEMKKRLDDYQDGGKDKWESFKSEFSHDMEAMGNSFKDLGVNNVK